MGPAERMSVSLLYNPVTKLFLGACFSISSFVGTLGNFISLYCLWKSKENEEKPRKSVLAILSLNISDLFNCMVVAPLQAIYVTNVFSRRHPIHLVHIYLTGTSSWFPAMMVFLIAMNRYIQINHFTRYQSIFKTHHMVSLILICLLFCVSAPSAAFAGSLTSLAIINEVIALFTMVTIPVFYVLIYRNMKKSHRKTHGTAHSSTVSSVSRNVLLLISIFLCCRFPTFLSSLIYLAKASNSIDQRLLSRLGMLFSALNSGINPFAYVFLDSSYRTTLRKLYLKYNSSQKVGSTSNQGDVTRNDISKKEFNKSQLQSS